MPHTRDLGQKCMASAISLLICFFTLGCIFHGCYLMKHLSGPRICILLTSPLVFALLLSNTAIEVNAPWLMQVSFALTGLGIGPSYLSAIIHLQFWLPKRQQQKAPSQTRQLATLCLSLLDHEIQRYI